MSKIALVTGAGGGLGLEFCKLLKIDGYEVVEITRNEFDLGEVGVAEKIVKKYPNIDVLINNAGFATHGKFTETNLKEEREEMTVNMMTLTELTKLYAQVMVKRGSGKILNVASTAAFLPGPFMAVYYASKAYVLSFSEALANELRGTGVTVTCLCPGPTATGFGQRANMNDTPLFKIPMQAAVVAKIGYDAMMTGRGTVVAGLRNWIQVLFNKFIPRSLAAEFARRVQH